MLRSGTTIRLTAADEAHFELLTGIKPVAINSVDALNRFIDNQKMQHQTGTPEGKLLTLLLNDAKIQD